MEELSDIPQEFLEPIFLCLAFLEQCNITVFDKETSFWKKHFRLFYMIPSVLLHYILFIVSLYDVVSRDIVLTELADTVSICVICTQTILRYVIVTSSKKEIRSLIVELGRMWVTLDLTEIQINKKNALLKKLKFCCTVFHWMTIIGTTEYIFAPLLETVFRKYILQQECGLLLPFSCSYPFDPTGNWARYIGVYIFETYNMFCIMYIFLGSEFLVLTLCSHLSTEFALLGERLEKFSGENIDELKIIIQRHQKLIGLSIDLDYLFHKMVFMNLAAAKICISFYAFSAKVAHGPMELFSNFLAVVTLTVPIFNLCYYGELLRETSSSIADSAYFNLWYKCSIQYQKLLYHIIKRAQQPCYLTSWKLTPITLATFSAVLSATWSYFSLCASLYEDESRTTYIKVVDPVILVVICL